MNAEQLLAMLRETGLDDVAIGNLLKDALASMSGPAVAEGPVDEEAEKAEAEKMLGL